MITIHSVPVKANTLLLVLLFLCLPCTSVLAEETQTEPPMFPTAEQWAAKDYKAAALYLTYLSKTDRDNLPKIDDEDGRFKSVVKNLKRIADNADITDQPDWQQTYIEDAEGRVAFNNEVLMPIFGAYGVANNRFNIIYEREVLTLLPLVINNQGMQIKAIRLLTGDIIKKDPSTWTDEQLTNYVKLLTVSGPTTNAMILVTINPGWRFQDLRSKILRDCQEPLTHLLWAMKEDDRETANNALDMLKSILLDPDEQAIVDKLMQSPRQPYSDSQLKVRNKTEAGN